jgi:fibronectin-binding autotransporter adhesin
MRLCNQIEITISQTPPEHSSMKTFINSASQLRKLCAVSLVTMGCAAATAFGDPNATVDYSWNKTTTPNSWSLGANWTPTAPDGGPDAAGLFVTINTNITATNTINLFNTGDAGDATKTLGRLDIGDTNGSNGFTIAAGTGAGVLDFNGNGGAAILNQVSTSGSNIISAPITLSTALNVSNASAANLSLGGVISGSNSITVNSTGTGAVTFSSASNSFSGLFINAGRATLDVNATSGTQGGTGGITLGNTAASTSNATLAFTTGNNDRTFASNITVAAGSSGTLSIVTTSTTQGRATLTGNIALNHDLVLTSNTSTLGGTGSNFAGLNLGGVITGSNSLIIDNSGLTNARVSVYGANSSSYTGTTIIRHGILTADAGNLGTGTVFLGDSATSGIGNARLEARVGGTTLANNITVAAGSGSRELAARNGGAAATYSGLITLNKDLTLDPTGGGSSITLSGKITGAGGLTKINANGVTLSGSTANDYTGTTQVNAGTLTLNKINGTTATNAVSGDLVIGNGTAAATVFLAPTSAGNDQIKDTSAVTINNTATTFGTLNLNSKSETIGSLGDANGAGSGAGSVALGTNAATGLTTGGNNNSTTFSGVISGSGFVTKTGTGTMTYAGANANTYTGVTTVNGGTLLLQKSDGVNAIAGNVKVNSTATLQLGQNNQINTTSAVELAGGKLNTGGFSDTVGTLTLSANSVLDLANGASILNFANSSTTFGSGTFTLAIHNWTGSLTGGGTDQVFFGSDNTGLTQQQLDRITFFSDSGTTSLGSAKILSSGEIVAIPEPAAALAGCMLLALAGFSRRRTVRRA